jgi:beta-glucosidase
VVSTEARAKYNDAIARGEDGMYHGLTFWSPNINIFRDPRWGRGQETYGEDPFLTATLGTSYVRGLQGDDPRYLKVAACAKHFAVHSGPEPLRERFNVNVDPQSLNDFYLVAFRALVRDAGVAGVMSAYSSLDGTPCSANVPLLHDKLREEWGFAGYVTSDCGAVDDLADTYHIAPDYAHAAALALKAGVDVSCGDTFASLARSRTLGLVTESDVDAALRHLLAIRFRLGMFDAAQSVPYSRLTLAQNDTPAHARLALQAARESIVLLKNDGVLPLRSGIRVAVVGPNADSLDALLGNYNGTPSQPMTLLAALRARLGNAVRYVRGCDYVDSGMEGEEKAALTIARESDIVVFAGGISPRLEGEEMPVKVEGFLGGDRTRIELPAVQTALLQSLHATGTPVVYVQMSGSAIACVWEARNLPAILQAWYPGESGGTAVADVLFGDYNPAGRLPVTFYASTDDLPPFEDYRLTNRTYRYFSGTPLFAFGHGLSYTRFTYSSLTVARAGSVLRARFVLRNDGSRDGDEVAQLYAHRRGREALQPLRQLCAFVRTRLSAGETRAMSLDIPLSRLATWNQARRDFDDPAGTYEIEAGASCADIRLRTQVSL